MITIDNVLMPNLSRVTIEHKFPKSIHIDGSKLLALPGLIDGHVHFCTPGSTKKEDWVHGARAAILGGITTVLDMPSIKPPTNSEVRLIEKYSIIHRQLKRGKIPIKFGLFFGLNHHHLDEVAHVRKKIIGLKVFLGNKTHPLVIQDESTLHTIYALAQTHQLLIALHIEDRAKWNLSLLDEAKEDYAKFSEVISPELASESIKFAIKMCELYGVPTYIMHVSSLIDVELIRQAKKQGLPIYAETSPHYLFFDERAYAYLKGCAKFNPPLRSEADVAGLWHAIADGTIDVVSSDHIPNPLSAKYMPLKDCPSGAPGVQTLLPLMLTAWYHGKVTLERLLEVLHHNPCKIFNLKTKEDMVLANIKEFRIVKDKDMRYKCPWTPYRGFRLTGFPEYVFTEGLWLDCKKL